MYSFDTQQIEMPSPKDYGVNAEPRCPLVLLLDTSASMGDDNRIDHLHQGLQYLARELRSHTQARLRVQICVITFNSRVEEIQPFVSVDEFQPRTFRPEGATHMGQALKLALARISEQKRIYKDQGVPYYRPWIFLLTDGEPYGEAPSEIQEAATRMREAIRTKKVLFYAVQVDPKAPLDALNSLGGPPALRLKAGMWREMFQWLSVSMQAASANGDAGDETTAPPTDSLEWVDFPEVTAGG